MRGLLTRSELNAAENGVLRAVCLMAGLALVVSASYNFMLPPMLTGLGATPAQGSLLRTIPSIGSLLVIFPAGILGIRLGPRRLLGAAGVSVAVGSLLVAAAPAVFVATVGMLLLSVGRSALFVIVIAMLTAATTRDGARQVAFSAYAMVSPAVYVGIPLLSGLLLSVAPWRSVAVLWAVSGLGIVAVAVLLVRDGGERDSLPGELWTPALAGLALTCVVRLVQAMYADGGLSVGVVVWGASAALASVVLAVLLRRLPAPSLSLRPLRGGGLVLLLLVVILIPFSNMWYYATLGLQFVYGKSVLVTAALLAIPQVASVFAASGAKRLMKAKGVTMAGTLLLLATSATLFLSCIQSVRLPLLIALLVLCLYSAAVIAAGVPLSVSIVSLADEGEEGSIASLRGAAGSLGGALGVIFMSFVVSVGIGSTSPEADKLVKGIRNGELTQENAAQYDVPQGDLEVLTERGKQAMVNGYRAHGLAGGIVTLGAAGVFFSNRRNHPEV